MKKIILIIILSIAFWDVGTSQIDVYYTQNATLQINGAFNNQPISGQSNDVGVSLNYETAEMMLRFNLNSLYFDQDTISSLFLGKDDIIVTFNGKLSLEYINTKDHPPMPFTIEGWLVANDLKTKLNGKGVIHHINDSGNYACMLSMNLELSLEDLNIEIPEGIYKKAEIVITQTLLQKDKH